MLECAIHLLVSYFKQRRSSACEFREKGSWDKGNLSGVAPVAIVNLTVSVRELLVESYLN